MTEVVHSNRPGCFEDYRAILTAIYQMAGGNPILDLGCGEAHVTKHWDGVYMDLTIRPTSPGKTIKADILDAPKLLAGFRYNLMVMSDVIEHLRMPVARKLLTQLEHICGAQFIFTPMGPFLIDADSLHPDAHKSGWFPEDFTANGWQVLAQPRYHIFSGDNILGAFYAWKFRDRPTPSVQEVLLAAGLINFT